jgi:hypothetical protein
MKRTNRHSTIQANQPTPSKAPQKGASDIHLPLLRSNSILGGAKSPLLKVEMGTGTEIAEWSDAARNHPFPLKITEELAEILGIKLDEF